MAPAATMRAAVARRYGPPGVVEVVDLPVPEPRRGEVLIRVGYSTVNRTCTGIRSATPPWGIRPAYGLRRPRREVLGTDLAGTVVGVGPAVTRHRIGDRVFGYDDGRMGAHAEFVCWSDKAALAPIPDGVDPLDAVSVVEGAHYALGLLGPLPTRPGSAVFVQGGGGAIGSAAIQILSERGAEVTAAVDDHQQALASRLGAAHTLDRATSGLTDLSGRFDLAVDAVGILRFGHVRSRLTDRGAFASVELGRRGEHLRLAATSRLRRGPVVRSPLPTRPGPHVATAARMLAAGTLQGVVDRVVGLDEIVDAHRRVDTGTKTGAVVVDLGTEPPITKGDRRDR